MKKYLCSVLLVVLPCLGHLHDERQELESGAARIIHTIRGAEQALVKDLRGNPRLLLSEERLLHQASKLALRAGKMKAKQLHSAQKLKTIEASLMQSGKSSSGALNSLAGKEAKLLSSGRGILQEVNVLKADFKKTLGKSNPDVASKLERLMERVDGAQREILSSEAQATVHAARLTAAIRKQMTPVAPTGAFAQQSTSESSGTKDPVRRLKLAKEALGQLTAAKSEVAEAYGSDDETAKKVEAMMDQLSSHMQGLEEESQAALKPGEEADMLADAEKEINAKRKTKVKKGDGVLIQARKTSLASKKVHGFEEMADMLVH